MDRPDQSDRPDPRADRPDLAEQVRDQGSRIAEPSYFRFSQLEFPWPLGPPDGRYLVRSTAPPAPGEPEHVIVLATLGSTTRHRRFRRNTDARPEPEPTEVTTGKATVVAVGSAFRDLEQARAWLEKAGEPELAADVVVLARALHAYRLASADPYLRPPGRHQALVARVGFGVGEEVADGRWTAARELHPARARRSRTDRLEPQARFAAILTGRERALACEELILRARLDLEENRLREGVLQALVALDAALAELAGDPAAGGLRERLDELQRLRPGVERAARSTFAGPLDNDQTDTVRFAVARIEAALRARSVARRG